MKKNAKAKWFGEQLKQKRIKNGSPDVNVIIQGIIDLASEKGVKDDKLESLNQDQYLRYEKGQVLPEENRLDSICDYWGIDYVDAFEKIDKGIYRRKIEQNHSEKEVEAIINKHNRRISILVLVFSLVATIIFSSALSILIFSIILFKRYVPLLIIVGIIFVVMGLFYGVGFSNIKDSLYVVFGKKPKKKRGNKKC